MKPEKKWGQIYADRALQPEPEPEQERGIVIPRVREARDLVYNGPMTQDESVPRSAPMPGVQRNRRSTKRKVSPFNVVHLLFAVAVVSVLYISNILAVSRLLREIDVLENTHRRLQDEQELMRADINRLSSLERVERVASEQLGLGTPTSVPVWLEVDQDRIAELERALNARQRR